MNITYVIADSKYEWNSTEWRCTIPARAFNRRPRRYRATILHINDFAERTPWSRYALESSDVIVLQRNIFPNTWEAIDYWKAQGKTVIVDVDDGYAQMTPDNVAYPFWFKGLVHTPEGPRNISPTPIEIYPECVRKTHGVTCAAPYLVRDWETYKSRWVPNYANLDWYKAKRTRGKDGELWVAWGGSMSHLASFTGSGILYAIARVLVRRPKTRLVICGADRRVFESIPLRDSQKIHIDWVPHDQWAGRLANFDIALAPLVGEYDKRRSWIKPLEYGLMRLPWIASDNGAYEGLEQYGRMVANTPDAWADALADVIDNGYPPATIKDAHAWASAQGIDDNIDKIAATYREFMP